MISCCDWGTWRAMDCTQRVFFEVFISRRLMTVFMAQFCLQESRLKTLQVDPLQVSNFSIDREWRMLIEQ